MWVQVPPGHPSHLVIRTQLERPAFTSPASSLGRTVRFLSATVAEIAKPEEGRLSGFDLLPRCYRGLENAGQAARRLT